jgi:hypothetical protein
MESSLQIVTLRSSSTTVVNVTAFSREDKLYDPQWTGPDIYVANNGDSISDFKVYYYFTAEPGKVPRPAVWDAQNAKVSLQFLGASKYRIVYDYKGFTLPYQWHQAWPSRTLVGVHYPDWSPVNKLNDASNNLSPTYLANPKIQFRDRNGNLIYGM